MPRTALACNLPAPLDRGHYPDKRCIESRYPLDLARPGAQFFTCVGNSVQCQSCGKAAHGQTDHVEAPPLSTSGIRTLGVPMAGRQ